ncbi:MAG TPA: AI-2E family transporter, partial [Anaerolineales bacterium]
MERPRWPYATKLTISLLLLGLVIFLLTRFHEIIPPVIIAIIIAYILNPIVNFFQYRTHLPRILVLLLTYILGLAIIISIPVLLIPTLTDNLATLQANTQQIITTIKAALSQQYRVGSFIIDPSSMLNQAVGAFQGLLQPIVGQTVSIAMRIISSFIWIIFIFLVSFYLTK